MGTDKKMQLTAYSYLEIAFIYAFAVSFDRSDIAPIHPIPFFTPKILEDALFMDSQDLLDHLMSSFLSNALNRKKLLEPESSVRPLNEYLNAKLRCHEFDLEYNPLSLHDGFKALPSDLKLKILYSLVEWQLQDSTSVRTIVDTLYATTKKGEVNPLVASPLGYDSQKRAYWQFGDSPYMWREKAHLKSGCGWEIVCRDLDELWEFAATTLEQTKSHKEKRLALHIKETLIPALKEKQKQQEIKDRAKARKIAALMALETPRELPRRARRKPARYNYSEDFMNLGDDDDDGDTWVEDGDGGSGRNQSPTQRAATRRPTRSSGRLHGDDAIVSYMEDMEIDSQQQQQHQQDNDGQSSSSTAVLQSSENETNMSDLDVDIDDKVTDSNDDDDKDNDVKAQQLPSDTKIWSTPHERKEQPETLGYYEEIDEDLDIV